MPIGHQFLSAQLDPLLDEGESTPRQLPVAHLTGRDRDLRLVLAVLGMEVRW
jgi:hypothetical protein